MSELLEVSDQDLGMARFDAVHTVSVWTKLPWEKELKHFSPEFWQRMQDDMRKIAQLDRISVKTVRSMLTIVFGAIYVARGNQLPQITRVKETDGIVKVLKFTAARFKKLNKLFAGEFIEHTKKLCSPSRVIAVSLVHALFEALDEEIGAVDITDRDSGDLSLYNSSSEVIVVEAEASPNVSFDEIGGQAEAKSEMKKLVAALRDPERYLRWGARPVRGVILYGPPGTGKTMFGKALATEAGVPFYNINSSDVASMWVSRGEKNVDLVFKKVRETGGILFFDEADALAPARAGASSHETSRKIVAALNRNMDGFASADRVVVIFATNCIEHIDGAVIRAGRIDRRIEVPLPDRKGRREIFNVHIGKAEKIAKRRLFTKLELDALLDRTDGYSGADIAEIIRRTLENKVQEEDRGGTPGLVIVGELLGELDGYEHMKKARNKIGFGALA